MSGTKLTLFGKENILFMLKRRSSADWSRTKVIYGGFSLDSVGHFLREKPWGRGWTAEFSRQSYIKTRTS